MNISSGEKQRIPSGAESTTEVRCSSGSGDRWRGHHSKVGVCIVCVLHQSSNGVRASHQILQRNTRDGVQSVDGGLWGDAVT